MLQVSYGHEMFTKDGKLNHHATVKISATFMQQNKYEKHFT